MQTPTSRSDPELEGIYFLNTRPTVHGDELNLRLKSMGANVVACPIVNLSPIAYAKWQVNLQQLNDCDTCILTSPFAAKHFLSELEKNKINTPQNLTFVAIGVATGKIIYEHLPHAKVIYPKTYDSEALCALQYWQDGMRNIIYPEGFDGGRGIIYKTLSKQGHNIINFGIYQRSSNNFDPQILNQYPINVVLITSELALRQFHKLLDKKLYQKFKNCHFLVFSKRLQKIGQDLQFPSTTVVEPDKLIDRLITIATKIQNAK
jgi:uroporphyrinogen-III synthase